MSGLVSGNTRTAWCFRPLRCCRKNCVIFVISVMLFLTLNHVLDTFVSACSLLEMLGWYLLATNLLITRKVMVSCDQRFWRHCHILAFWNFAFIFWQAEYEETHEYPQTLIYITMAKSCFGTYLFLGLLSFIHSLNSVMVNLQSAKIFFTWFNLFKAYWSRDAPTV
jgi:hypothetical protein